MHAESSVYTELLNLSGFASTMCGGRPENQDDFGFLDTPLGFLFVLCDGMGGGPGGKTASYIAKNEIAASIKACNSLTPPERALSEAFIRANEAIEKKTKEDPSLIGMGSTAVALIIGKQSAFVAHVGDSRLYHFRNGKLLWRTTDHSLVNDLVEMKALTEEQARTSPQSNVITKGLGATNNHTPDIVEIWYEAGDRFVLCSDGVWGIMSAKDLIPRLIQNAGSDTVVKTLQDEIDCLGVQQGGDHDNHTLVVIDLKEHSQKVLNMVKKLKTIIGILGVLCSVLLISLFVCFMRNNDKDIDNTKDEIYAEMHRFKHKYEELNQSKEDNIDKLIREKEELGITVKDLREEISTLEEKLKSLEAERDALIKDKSTFTLKNPPEKQSTKSSQSFSEDSPKAIAGKIVKSFDNILNCKKTEQKDAVRYIDDKYNEILMLLNYMDEKTDKYKPTTKGIRDYINNPKVVKNTVRKIEDEKTMTVYFVPTKPSSETAKKLRDKIINLKVK